MTDPHHRYVGLALAVTGTLAIGNYLCPLMFTSKANMCYQYRNEFCHYEESMSHPRLLKWIYRTGKVDVANRFFRALWMQRNDKASKEMDSHT